MDFFGAQDRARSATSRLLWYYGLAVVTIFAAIYFAVTAGFYVYEYYAFAPVVFETPLFTPERVLVTAGATFSAIALAALAKHSQLRAGGAAVCESLGGRRVDARAVDALDKKFINVAQEMAIASGVPMPRLYVLDDEPAINAFAAGLSPNDAAIAVTRGTLSELSRDELQGVVAHEYSHILNGDMRLNLRLVAALHGILALTILARALRHMSFPRVRSSGSGKNKGGAGALIIAVIVVIILVTVIGAIGSFFARLIQAAISREREFLADASAVQFTRNPEGVADALRRVGGHGSRVDAKGAPAFAHSFFASVEDSWWSRALATHPPLASRIRAVNPRWSGEMLATRTFTSADAPSTSTASRLGAPLPDVAVGAWSSEGPGHSASLLALAGTLAAPQLAFAERLLQGIPEAVKNALIEPGGAEALIYVLLLHQDPTMKERQWNKIEASLEPDVKRGMRGLSAPLKNLDPRARLPLLELALPSLSGTSSEGIERIRRNIDAMILVDDRVGLFEFVVRRLVKDRLVADATHVAADPLKKRAPDAQRIRASAAEVLSAVVASELLDPRAARELVIECSTKAGFAAPLAFVPPQSHFAHLDAALDVLRRSRFEDRRMLLDACERAIRHDREISTTEAELFRAICGALDVPIAPIV